MVVHTQGGGMGWGGGLWCWGGSWTVWVPEPEADGRAEARAQSLVLIRKLSISGRANILKHFIFCSLAVAAQMQLGGFEKV